MRSQAARLVPAAVCALGDPDRALSSLFEAELGRIMEHYNRTAGGQSCAHASIESGRPECPLLMLLSNRYGASII